MSEVFLQIVNMSISAGWLILAVLLCRLLLKRAPKWVRVALWGIVAVRLFCPFSIESALSLIPNNQTVSPEIMLDPTPAVDTGVGFVNSVVNPIIAGSFTPNPATSANPLQILIPVWSVIWVAGMVIMLLYTLISYWRIRRRVSTAVLLRDNIFQSEHVSTPFVLGLFRPRIYLPFGLGENELYHVVSHERAHIRRKDHLWKPLGFLLLSIHWFNPLVWLAYVLLCRDIELACDEKVIKELDGNQRANYTQALVFCSIRRHTIAACPLAFGEVGVKSRVKSVMDYKKPAFWIVVVAVVLCIAVAVCFLTDPIGVSSEPDLSFLNYKNAASVAAEQEEVMAIYCPTSDSNSDSLIQIGAASGKDLAKYLDQWDWRECKEPREVLSSPGSVEFIIEDDYRITVYQRKRGSLRQYAVVRYQEDVRYYQIDSHDYPDAVAMVYAAAQEPAAPSDMQWDRIPMVMVDDILFLDTGEQADDRGLTGQPEGEITSSVDQSQLPTQNGQSNFGTGYPYRYGTMWGTMEVYSNGKWWIYAREEVRHLVQFPGNGEFFLTVGADNVSLIEYSMPGFSGGCENANGRAYLKGEQIWLEPLNTYQDLRGLEIWAWNDMGELVWQAAVPNIEENRGFTRLIQDDWTVTNLP